MGHGVCMEVAPDYFEPDEDGYVALRSSTRRLEDSPELRLAEMNCPMQVITVHDDPPAMPRED